MSESLLDKIQEIEICESTDAALDCLFDEIDWQMQDADWSGLDLMLTEACVNDYSCDILLGVLTTTLPGKSKLPSRRKFFYDVETVLKNRGKWENGLLDELE